MRSCDPAGTARRRMPGLILCATLVFVPAAPAALAAQASAATISVTKPCYVNANPVQSTPITILGNGFTTGDQIQISGNGVLATATAAPDGTFSVTTAGPMLSNPGPATRTFTLTATDQTTPIPTAVTTVTMANLGVVTTPSRARPTQKVTWHFSGFTPGKSVWIHYLHHKKVIAKMRFGRATGACGTLQTRALLYPGGHPPFKLYTVVFDDSKNYSKRSRPQIVTTLIFGLF